MTWANHVTDCLLMLTPSTAAAAAAIEFHGSMPSRHAHLRSSCQNKHSRVPLPVDSVVHLRKQHPNSAGPPPPVFLHTEVPLQIPAVTAAPALALQLGIIRRWRARGPAESTLSLPRGQNCTSQERGDRKTDRQSGVFVNLAHILTQPGRPFPSPSRTLLSGQQSPLKVRCPATSESPKGPPKESGPCHAAVSRAGDVRPAPASC